MGKNSKRPKSYYIQSVKRQKRGHNVLSQGLQGFLCTCSGYERDCVREAYNILNQFGNQLYGPEKISVKPPKDDESDNHESKSGEVANGSKKSGKEENTTLTTSDKGEEGRDSDEEEELDIDAALKADLEEINQQKTNTSENREERSIRRFQQVESGAVNCIFIKTTVPDPLSLSLAIMDNIIDTQEQCTKRLLRMIPVQATCKAFLGDIEKASKQLAEKFFEKGGKSFYIVFKARNNNSVKREDVTEALIKILQEAHPENSPDMKCPEVTLNVELIRNNCCLSFLPYYLTKYSKYNLLSIATKAKEEQQKGNCDQQKQGSEEKGGKCEEQKEDGVKKIVEDKLSQNKDDQGENVSQAEEKGGKCEEQKEEGVKNIVEDKLSQNKDDQGENVSQGGEIKTNDGAEVAKE